MTDIESGEIVEGVDLQKTFGNVQACLKVNGVNSEVTVGDIFAHVIISGVSCTLRGRHNYGCITIDGVNCTVYLSGNTGSIKKNGVNCNVIISDGQQQGHFNNSNSGMNAPLPGHPNLGYQHHNVNLGNHNFAAFTHGIFGNPNPNAHPNMNFMPPMGNFNMQHGQMHMQFQPFGPPPPGFNPIQFQEQFHAQHMANHMRMHHAQVNQMPPPGEAVIDARSIPRHREADENDEYVMDRRGTKVEIEKISGSTISIEEECIVCMSKMNKMSDNCGLLDCLHWFHYECAKDWLRREAACPLCKISTSRLMMTCP